MGTKGFLAAFVAAFLTVNIYKVCISHNVTIKLPKEVPGSIAQSFRDIFAFGFSILACAFIDLASRKLLAVPFANLVSALISPLFSAVDTYPGMALIEGAVALFQFMGIHGASVVMSPINAALYGNTVPILRFSKQVDTRQLLSRRTLQASSAVWAVLAARSSFLLS